MSTIIDKEHTFNEYAIDELLKHQLSKLGYEHPTIVQSQFIPIALSGKDIVTQARTGSGKTLAYVIPILHNLLTTQQQDRAVRAIILNPSRELCHQCKEVIDTLLRGYYGVTVLNVANDTSVASQKGKIKGTPDIITGTPATLLNYIKKTGISLDFVDVVVFDEVDLMISYGYESDCKELIKLIPTASKKWMLSATITDDVETLKQLLMKNAVRISVEDTVENVIEEYVINCEAWRDKALQLYVLLKLGMVHGKVLIFVNSIDRCFFVKVFLDMFSISSVVLNSDLPRDVRTHIIEQFNNNEFNILIATDEVTIEKVLVEKEQKETLEGEESVKENYSVSRGVDFQNVACVINYDCPVSAVSYTHRIGRTGRGLRKGIALTIVTKDDVPLFSTIKRDRTIKEFTIEPVALNSFKTRVYDIQQAVTKNVCKEARLKDYKREIGNNEKLSKTLKARGIRHNTILSKRREKYLKDVPDYLVSSAMTQTLKGALTKQNEYEKKGDFKKRTVTKPKKNGASFVKKMASKFQKK